MTARDWRREQTWENILVALHYLDGDNTFADDVYEAEEDHEEDCPFIEAQWDDEFMGLIGIDEWIVTLQYAIVLELPDGEENRAFNDPGGRWDAGTCMPYVEGFHHVWTGNAIEAEELFGDGKKTLRLEFPALFGEPPKHDEDGFALSA